MPLWGRFMALERDRKKYYKKQPMIQLNKKKDNKKQPMIQLNNSNYQKLICKIYNKI